MPAERPERFVKGETITALKLNQQVDAINRVMDVPGWDTARTGSGDAGLNLPPYVKLGMVVDTGPSGLNDYTDERYWVRECFIGAGETADPVVLQQLPDYQVPDPTTDGGTVTVAPVYTVTNLAELVSHSHGLPVNTPVLFFKGFMDGTEPTPNIRYLMAIGGGENAPEYSGDVHRGVANGVAGWGPMTVENYTP